MPEIWKIVTYTIEDDTELPLVRTAIQRFVAAVATHEPETRYDAWQETAEPSRFVHLMRFADEAAESRHRQAGYTDEFVAVLYPRCRQPPAFRDLRSIR